MPKKRTIILYSIRELSDKSRRRAIDDFRPHAFDDTDVRMLTEDFEQRLQEQGFQDGVKVNWSLGHVQGDGVCFGGRLDPGRLIRERKLTRFQPVAKLADDGILTIRIHHEDTRSCHANSMYVDAELRGEAPDLLSEERREEFEGWSREVRRATRAWFDETQRIFEERMKPVRTWERLKEDFDRRRERGPREWSPRLKDPGPKPAPLEIPEPPRPVIEQPPGLAAALAEAETRWKAIYELVEEFREWLKEWVESVSHELEKIGYEEIAYRESDEAIIDHFEANEYEFTKDGERYRR